MTAFPQSHADFERDNEDEAAYQRELERQRRAAHTQRHGSLDGYRPPRGFPCPGILRVVDSVGPQAVVVCSECGFEITVRNPSRPPLSQEA